MTCGRSFVGLALGAALLLPAPDTESRDRSFCASWLRLAVPARQAVLREAELREGDAGECRQSLRPALRNTLDAECRNWRLLMDFEVRALVDRSLEPCAAAGS